MVENLDQSPRRVNVMRTARLAASRWPGCVVVVATASALVAGLLTGCREEAPSEVRPSVGGVPGAVAVVESLPDGEGYVGSASCISCHRGFYELWSTSWHGLAMQPFTPEFAKAHLTETAEGVEIAGRIYRVELGGGDSGGVMRETGPEGERGFPMVHAMGGKNVYYFLTPMEKGRLQVMPLAYDVHKNAWFDTAASGVRHFPDRTDEALHWTDRLFTFNTTCFNCHVSRLATEFDLASQTYHTTWAEPGISCESCHGPAGPHVEAMQGGETGRTSEDIKILRAVDLSARQMNDLCATCHAKMAPLSLDFLPGDSFFDHYDLITLEHPDYHPDGRDLGENYTYTSWLMSPCAESGTLDCNDCHTPSGRMRFKDAELDQACLPCHKKQVEDPVAHSHHPAGGAGGRCVDCHMPMSRFANMNRSDHSMLPPTPAVTRAFNSPNACTMCHDDRDADWADHWVRQWYPRDYQAPVLERAGLVAAARADDWSKLPEILSYLQGGEGDVVTRASLARLLERSSDEQTLTTLIDLLDDPSPLVRAGAASSLTGKLTAEVLDALLDATRDESRLVRIRAAMALAPVSPATLSEPGDRESLRRATAEFEASMKARPDDWASYANLGNHAMERGDFRAAVAHFATASTLEPRSVGPLTNAAIAHSNLNQPREAESSLRRALKAEPENAAVNFNLGLLLGEQGRRDEAERALRAALKTDPSMAAAAYNLGVILAEKDLAEAITWCRKAHELSPNEGKYAHSLAFYLRQSGDIDGSIAVLREAIERNPLDIDSTMLLGQTLAGRGDPKAAAGVFRALLGRDGLSGPLQDQLVALIRQLEAMPTPGDQGESP